MEFNSGFKGLIVEIKISPFHNTTAYRESKMIAPIILNLYGIWRRVLDVTPPPFFLWGRTHVTLNRRLGESHSRSGIFGESFEPRIIQPVA